MPHIKKSKLCQSCHKGTTSSSSSRWSLRHFSLFDFTMLCFAPDCKHRETNGCKFYTFPKDPATLRQWTRIIRWVMWYCIRLVWYCLSFISFNFNQISFNVGGYASCNSMLANVGLSEDLSNDLRLGIALLSVASRQSCVPLNIYRPTWIIIMLTGNFQATVTNCLCILLGWHLANSGYTFSCGKRMILTRLEQAYTLNCLINRHCFPSKIFASLFQ